MKQTLSNYEASQSRGTLERRLEARNVRFERRILKLNGSTTRKKNYLPLSGSSSTVLSLYSDHCRPSQPPHSVNQIHHQSIRRERGQLKRNHSRDHKVKYSEGEKVKHPEGQILRRSIGQIFRWKEEQERKSCLLISSPHRSNGNVKHLLIMDILQQLFHPIWHSCWND